MTVQVTLKLVLVVVGSLVLELLDQNLNLNHYQVSIINDSGSD